MDQKWLFLYFSANFNFTYYFGYQLPFISLEKYKWFTDRWMETTIKTYIFDVRTSDSFELVSISDQA